MQRSDELFEPSSTTTMPFISKDWRSPGEEWVKTGEGWEKKKILECSNLVDQHDLDTSRYVPLFTRSADLCFGGEKRIIL